MTTPAWMGCFAHDGWAHVVAALLHTLWQGALAAGLLFVLLRRIPGRRSGTRYAAAGAALMLTVLAGAVTWGVLERGTAAAEPSAADVVPARAAAGQAAPIVRPPVAQPAGDPSADPDGSVASNGPGAASNGWAATAVCAWLVGVVLMLCRAFLLVSGAGRLNRCCRPAEEGELAETVRGLARAMGIGRRVRIAVGERLSGPAVLGLVRPTLLVPAAMISGLPPEQLRMILAHELAHVRRYDYLVNVVQMLIEALLFFNPAVWWISRRMRIEREACCDAAAVAATGRPRDYARALADWVERSRTAPPVGAAMALDGGEGQGALLDRLKRMLVSGYRPSMRARWYTVAALMFGATVALAVAAGGAGAAAQAAAELISPQERVRRMAEIEQTHGERQYTEADKIDISGTVRTEDGAPLPAKAYVQIRSKRPGSGYTAGLDAGTGGRFSYRIDFGAVDISATADGYAPAFAGPFEVEPGDELPDVELVLKRGFTAGLLMLGKDGRLVPGAELHGEYVRGKSGVAGFSARSGPDGVAAIEHCAEAPVRINVTADGYQFDQRELTLRDTERPVEWQLRPARPAMGVVVSAVTGEPVEGAELFLVQRQGVFPFGWGPELAPFVAQTDARGRFALTTLPDGADYDLLVRAPGHGKALVQDVRAGETNREVRLGPRLSVRGRVVGPLDELRTHRRRPCITYVNPYRLHDTSFSYQETVTLDVADGEGRFAIDDLWPGRLTIHAGKKRVDLDLTEPVEDLVIDLAEKDPTVATRPVVVRIQVPEGSPPAEGTLTVQAFPDEGPPLFAHPALKDGEARVDVPVPGRVHVSGEGLVGYWWDRSVRQPTRVAPGEEPFVITIPVTPAGAIYGRVIGADGRPADEASLSLVVANKAPSMGGSHLDLNTELTLPGARYNAGPLPLGGTYMIVAHRAHAYVAGPPLLLNDQTPLREVDLKFVDGVTLSVRVLDPDGKPVPHAEVKLGYETPYSHGFGGAAVTTDADGRVAFEYVNPDAPGAYYLSLPLRRTYQPVHMRVKPDGRPVTIRLEKGLTLDGVVIDAATGRPVPGADVFAHATDVRTAEGPFRRKAERVTNARGEFRFSNLGDGEYRLMVSDARLADPQRDLRVRGGLPGAVQVRVELPEWSSLRPAAP